MQVNLVATLQLPFKLHLCPQVALVLWEVVVSPVRDLRSVDKVKKWRFDLQGRWTEQCPLCRTCGLWTR